MPARHSGARTRLGACGAAVESPGPRGPQDDGPGAPRLKERRAASAPPEDTRGALRSSSPQQPQQPESGWASPRGRTPRLALRSCIRGWRAGPCELGSPRRPQGARQLEVLQLRQPPLSPGDRKAKCSSSRPSAWITGSFCACSLCTESIKVGAREGLATGSALAGLWPAWTTVGPPVPGRLLWTSEDHGPTWLDSVLPLPSGP